MKKIKVPFLDLRVLDLKERSSILNAVETVMNHGIFINGPELTQLEEEVAGICSRKYAVGVNSGTDALFLGLRGLGLQSGDEVITTSLSWVATANAIALTGACPVFADIKEDLNIDPKSVEKLITRKTKAILAVHYTGRVCKMEVLRKIVDQRGIMLVEDAAQAFTAKRNGQPAGSFGDIACFSMNPMKVFAACGEAGMILTDDEALYNKITTLRYNGTVNRETCVQPSLNGRLDTLQAAILLRRLASLPGVIDRRRDIAGQYDMQLSGLGSHFRTPLVNENEYHVYYTYTVLAEKRDELKVFLEEEKGIECKIQYPVPMPNQPAYRGWTVAEKENAEMLCRKVLCIPSHEKMNNDQVRYVSESIKEFYG